MNSRASSEDYQNHSATVPGGVDLSSLTSLPFVLGSLLDLGVYELAIDIFEFIQLTDHWVT